MESRVNRAVALFESGYNCAQSLFAAYADLFGMDREAALKLSSPMGAGIGRMREVCGAVSSMSLLLGLKEGNSDAADEEAKKRIYEKTRQMADSFKEINGSIICRELLGIEGREESAAPSVRDAAYYASRPCPRLIACAARIVEDMLLSETCAADCAKALDAALATGDTGASSEAKASFDALEEKTKRERQE